MEFCDCIFCLFFLCISSFFFNFPCILIISMPNIASQAFWDYSEKKLLGTTKAECSVTSEWSPDGRYFMTATTAPRLQIDNGYLYIEFVSC